MAKLVEVRNLGVHGRNGLALSATQPGELCPVTQRASQWVMNGGSMEMLSNILGHSSKSTTLHYAHLAPDFFGAKAFEMVAVDLSRPTGNVVHLAHFGGTIEQRIGRTHEDGASGLLA